MLFNESTSELLFSSSAGFTLAQRIDFKSGIAMAAAIGVLPETLGRIAVIIDKISVQFSFLGALLSRFHFPGTPSLFATDPLLAIAGDDTLIHLYLRTQSHVRDSLFLIL